MHTAPNAPSNGSGRKTEALPLRRMRESEMAKELQKMDASTGSIVKSLDTVKARAEDTVQNLGRLEKLKSGLREAEDDFVKVLAVKTRKEVKQVELRENISATKARIETIKRSIQAQRARRDEFTAMMSECSLADRKGNQDLETKEEIQEAMSWYNKVFRFQIECGRGVKFTFTNINPKNSHAEYTFTVRFENNTYSLMACDPQLNGTKDLILELNRTNGLFGFVRTMRRKFQEAASIGYFPQSTTLQQESSVSISGPLFSVSTDGSDTPEEKDERPYEEKRHWSRDHFGKRAKTQLLSPLSIRHSPRLQAKK